MATRTDIRALVAATQVEATPLVLGGVSWPLRKPSTATVNAFMARFPDAADVVAELVFAARVDGDDKEAVFTAATDHLTSLMAARGAEFCGAWLGLCLGGEPDPDTERDLVQLPDEIIVPLWAAAIDVCPEGLEPFFGAMAVGAGVPPQPETAEPQADKPKVASRRRSTRSSG